MDKESVTRDAIEEIKKDAHELTKIAIEDGIAKTQAINMFHLLTLGMINYWSMEKILEEVKQYSDKQGSISEIVGRTIISKRYTEKILSIATKYYRRPNDLDLLTRSTAILYDDQNQQETKISG